LRLVSQSDDPVDPSGRLLFCFSDGKLIVLHGFIKKTQKTPDAELELARKRMRKFK
jgi:phage-related protein